MIRPSEGQPDESTLKGKAQREAIKLAQKMEDNLLKKGKGKNEKTKKKGGKKSGTSSEKLTTAQYQETLIRITAQIAEQAQLLGGLKDASEMAEAGDTEIQSIFDSYLEIVRLATEQEDDNTIRQVNERRSAVGRIVSAIGEIKDDSILKKITGEELSRLFSGAIAGSLSVKDAQAEIAKFASPTALSKAEPVPAPVVEVLTQAEAGKASQVTKAEGNKGAKKTEASVASAEEFHLDLSNPKDIPEFVRLLRSAKNRTIDVQFSKGRPEKVRIQDLAKVAQRHIINLNGMAKNPQRQSKEALGILKVAPQDFGYRDGLRKLFLDLKFINDTPAPKPASDAPPLKDGKVVDSQEASAKRAEKIRLVEESVARIAEEQRLITEIISNPNHKTLSVQMREILKSLNEVLAKDKSLTEASLAKKAAGYGGVVTELTRMRHELQKLVQSTESTKVTPESDPTESAIAKVRHELEGIYQSIEKAWVDSDYGDDPKLTKKILSILPEQSMDERMAEFADKTPQEKLVGYTSLLTEYRELLTRLKALLAENAHLLKKAQPTSGTDGATVTQATPHPEPLATVEEVDGEVRVRLGAGAKAKRDALIEKEIKSKKIASSPKAETVPKIPQEALDQEQRQLQAQFTEIEAKVAVLLSLHKADTEIQSHAPKEVGADILLKLEGKSFAVRNTILQESIVTYRNALQAIEAILDQRKQARATATGGAPSRPNASAQSSTAPGTPVPPASAPAPKQGWFQSRWAKAVSYAAAGAALLGIGFGANELVKKVSEKNARKGDRPETAERTPSTNETVTMPRNPEATLRPTQSVERPQTNQIRTPDAPRAPEAVESYPGINFNAELLKYPGATKSGWVLELFTHADRDVQMIQTPQDFHRFFEHYFGELNLGNRDLMPNRDPKVDQQQFNEFSRRFPNSTRFDVKMAYKWIGPEDVKLRLALATKLREVLIATHFRFANTPGADNFIHYPQRLNNCAVLMNTLIKGMTEKLDPTFDYKTITDNAGALDRLIELQKQRN